MFRTLIVGTIVVVALTVASGMIQGRLSNRWAVAEELKSAGELLQQLPSEPIGAWNVTGTMEFSEAEIKMLECTGYVARTYTNRSTGDVLRMFILVGPRGPISVHTPDVCFSSREYKIPESSEPETVITADGSKQVLWRSIFESRSEEDQHDLISWHGWSTGGDWTAPKYQRLAYLGSPYLYKIQIACRVRSDRQETEKLVADFLRDFLPTAAQYRKQR